MSRQACAPLLPVSRLAQARAQASVNAYQIIFTYTVVAWAFLSAVVFVNSGTQRSVDDLKNLFDGKFADLKQEAADAKKDTDSKFALSFILFQIATLATVHAAEEAVAARGARARATRPARRQELGRSQGRKKKAQP